VADRLRTSKSCEGASSRSATQPAPTNPSEKQLTPHLAPLKWKLLLAKCQPAQDQGHQCEKCFRYGGHSHGKVVDEFERRAVQLVREVQFVGPNTSNQVKALTANKVTRLQ
jgi:hypothetical protein